MSGLWRMKTVTDEELWAKLKSCICHCLLKNVTSMDQLYVGKAKHTTYETCKSILKKHWDDENVDPKRSLDCIEKHIFNDGDFPVPESQIILGFFYVAYLMVAKNIPDMTKNRDTNVPTIVFTTGGTTGPPAPPAVRPSSSGVDSLEKLIKELMKKVKDLENNQEHTRNQHKAIWQGPGYNM